MGQPQIDVEVSNHSSIVTFYPVTDVAKQWLALHVRGETVAEARYAWDILQGMLDAGLVLQDTRTGRLAHRFGGGPL
jgi:hypothetical protein